MKTDIINIKTVEEYASSILKENPVLFSKLEKIEIEGVAPEELFLEVLKFMYLVSVFNTTLTPSLIVDLGWHEFILFTKTYEKFCSKELGRFIHHTPEEDKTTNNRNYLKTIQHYINIFGRPPVNIWGEISNSEWKDSQCGSCKSN